MDKQEYLNHITAKPKPAAAKTSLLDKLLTPKNLKVAVVAVFALVVLIVVGSILSQDNNKATVLTERLSLRLGNITSTIDTFSKNIKNPELRAISTSLKATLTDTSRDLTALLPALKVDTKNLKKSASATTETDHINELNTDLEHARLNGILDRTFAKDMTLQTSLLLSLEADLLARTKNADLTSLLENSTKSITALHARINDFSNKSN
jgi:hypothetical protein